jgi:hypothetical protein
MSNSLAVFSMCHEQIVWPHRCLKDPDRIIASANRHWKVGLCQATSNIPVIRERPIGSTIL